MKTLLLMLLLAAKTSMMLAGVPQSGPSGGPHPKPPQIYGAGLDGVSETCKEMPVNDISNIVTYLKSDKWRNGIQGVPWIYPGAAFVFDAGRGKCWIVTVMENPSYILVEDGTFVNGKPRPKPHSLRQVEHFPFPLPLISEIKKRFPDRLTKGHL